VGGGGQREGRGAAVQKYSSHVHGVTVHIPGRIYQL
jgi:hypothetical protein